MCAIAGIIGLPWDPRIIESLLATMHRRGPDAADFYETETAALLHSRLSVVDPEGGSQPMKLTYQGETYVIVYNGELYNTEEVRHDLLRAGHSFRSHSDTEVVLQSFIRWGEDCVSRFNGIFAFGVWRTRRRQLFLARDPMGVKPLFFMEHEGGLLFASEIKTILVTVDVLLSLSLAT